jgi:hypothetical protein
MANHAAQPRSKRFSSLQSNQTPERLRSNIDVCSSNGGFLKCSICFRVTELTKQICCHDCSIPVWMPKSPDQTSDSRDVSRSFYGLATR